MADNNRRTGSGTQSDYPGYTSSNNPVTPGIGRYNQAPQSSIIDDIINWFTGTVDAIATGITSSDTAQSIIKAGIYALGGYAVASGINYVRNSLIPDNTRNTTKRRSNTYNFIQSRNNLAVGERVPEWFGTMQTTPDIVATPYRLYTSGPRTGSGPIAAANQREYYLFLISRGQVNLSHVIYGHRIYPVRTNGTFGRTRSESSGFGAQVITGGQINNGISASSIYYDFINYQSYHPNIRLRTAAGDSPSTLNFEESARQTEILSPKFPRAVVAVDLALDVTTLTSGFVAGTANTVTQGSHSIATKFLVESRNSPTGSYQEVQLDDSTLGNDYLRRPFGGELGVSLSGTDLAQIVNIRFPVANANYIDIRLTAVAFDAQNGEGSVATESRLVQVLYSFANPVTVTADDLAPYSDYTMLAVYRNAEALLEGLDESTLLKVRGQRALPRPYADVNTLAGTNSASAAFNYLIGQASSDLVVNDANLLSLDSRQFNAILDTESNFIQSINLIALATITKFIVRGSEVFLRDITAQGTPVAYFTAADVLVSSLRFEVNMFNKSTTTALYCTFLDSTNDRYLSEYLSIDAEGVIEEHERLGTKGNLTLLGTTDPAQVRNILNYALREYIYRGNIVIFQTSFQALQIVVGDVINLQHEGIFTTSVSAYIQSAAVMENEATFTLSENATPDDNRIYLIGYDGELLYTFAFETLIDTNTITVAHGLTTDEERSALTSAISVSVNQNRTRCIIGDVDNAFRQFIVLDIKETDSEGIPSFEITAALDNTNVYDASLTYTVRN